MKRTFDRYRHFAAWLSVAVLSVAVWLHAFALAEQDRAAAIAEAVKTLSNLTRVAQEQASRPG